MTVSCSERGFLLARVRDELNLTLLSYQTLYESSLAFGVRKALQAEIGRVEMQEEIEQLKHVEQQLECQKMELKVELERNAKRAQEDMEALKRQHAEEVESLQQSNKQLKVTPSENPPHPRLSISQFFFSRNYWKASSRETNKRSKFSFILDLNI